MRTHLQHFGHGVNQQQNSKLAIDTMNYVLFFYCGLSFPSPNWSRQLPLPKPKPARGLFLLKKEVLPPRCHQVLAYWGLPIHWGLSLIF